MKQLILIVLGASTAFLWGLVAQREYGLLGEHEKLEFVPRERFVEPNDTDRRENLLMPQKDSKPWQEWTQKYGDSVDSWTMFTIAFHTRYLGELNQRITKLEKAQDSNEPNTATR